MDVDGRSYDDADVDVNGCWDDYDVDDVDGRSYDDDVDNFDGHSDDVDTIYQPLRSGRIWHKVNF